MTENKLAKLRDFYDRLLSSYGPQHWWPAESPTEVIIGAILTQNTAWRNVERAIEQLKQRGLIDFAAIHMMPESRLAAIIRPAGTYRVKAARLKALTATLFRNCGGDLEQMLGGNLESARDRLLAIRGIGPETADAILLYAADRPTFVVDAYTRRILRRHLLLDGDESYDEIRQTFHDAIHPDPPTYNEYHALLVAVAKFHCRKVARCEGCPLADWPHDEAV